MKEGEVNLWIRAEMEQYSGETLELIPEDRRTEYAEVIAKVAVAKIALNEALGERYEFFKDVGAYDVRG